MTTCDVCKLMEASLTVVIVTESPNRRKLSMKVCLACRSDLANSKEVSFFLRGRQYVSSKGKVQQKSKGEK